MHNPHCVLGMAVARFCKAHVCFRRGWRPRVQTRRRELASLCAWTTEPSSFQVPPRRSMRTTRRICSERRLRSADVAKRLKQP